MTHTTSGPPVSKSAFSQSKILIDATIPFQIKPWEYKEMKNSDEKVNIGAFRDVKKQNNRNESSNVIF